MSTTIQHTMTQNHRVPFYDDELLRGLPSPWTFDESERNIVAHYSSYGNAFHWFVSYYSPIHNIAFGFVMLDGDTANGKWHEFDLGELEGLSVTQPVFIHGRSMELTIPVVERDPNFEICVFGELRQSDEYAWINESRHVLPLR